MEIGILKHHHLVFVALVLLTVILTRHLFVLHVWMKTFFILQYRKWVICLVVKLGIKSIVWFLVSAVGITFESFSEFSFFKAWASILVRHHEDLSSISHAIVNTARVLHIVKWGIISVFIWSCLVKVLLNIRSIVTLIVTFLIHNSIIHTPIQKSGVLRLELRHLFAISGSSISSGRERFDDLFASESRSSLAFRLKLVILNIIWIDYISCIILWIWRILKHYRYFIS